MPEYLRSRRPAFNISSCKSVNTNFDSGSFDGTLEIRKPSSGWNAMGTHLVLDEELDTLNGGGSGLGDGGGNTTHCDIVSKLFVASLDLCSSREFL